MNDSTLRMKVDVFNAPPFISVIKDEISGAGIELWDFITEPFARMPSIKIAIHNENPEYGMFLENGSWTGIFEILQNNVSDAIILGMNMDYDPSNSVQYSAPFTISSMATLASHEEDCDSSTLSTHYPDISIMMMFLFAISLFTFGVLSMVTAIIKHKTPTSNDFFLGIFDFTKIIMGQSFVSIPELTSYRLLFTTYQIGCIFFLGCYYAEMQAKMKFCELPPPETIEDVVTHEDCRPSISRNIPGYHQIMFSDDDLVQNLASKIKETDGILEWNYLEMDSLKKLLLEEERTIISTEVELEYGLGILCRNKDPDENIQEELNVHFEELDFMTSYVAFAFHRNIPKWFLETVNRRLLVFVAAGLWLAVEDDREEILRSCLDHEESGQSATHIEETTIDKLMLLKVLCFGFAFAAFCLVCKKCQWTLAEENRRHHGPIKKIKKEPRNKMSRRRRRKKMAFLANFRTNSFVNHGDQPLRLTEYLIHYEYY